MDLGLVNFIAILGAAWARELHLQSSSVSGKTRQEVLD